MDNISRNNIQLALRIFLGRLAHFYMRNTWIFVKFWMKNKCKFCKSCFYQTNHLCGLRGILRNCLNLDISYVRLWLVYSFFVCMDETIYKFVRKRIYIFRWRSLTLLHCLLFFLFFHVLCCTQKIISNALSDSSLSSFRRCLRDRLHWNSQSSFYNTSNNSNNISLWLIWQFFNWYFFYLVVDAVDAVHTESLKEMNYKKIKHYKVKLVCMVLFS